MANFFRQRLNSHLTEMLKYLRLVFNDYFVLALLFFIGGVGYYYSNALKNIQANQIWQPILIVFIFWLGLQLGKLATLVKKPDYIFLSPKEKGMYNYLNGALIYSGALASVVQLLIWVIMIPFIQVSLEIDTYNLVSLGITLLVLKLDLLIIAFINNYQTKVNFLISNLLVKWLYPLLILIIAVFFNYLLALILSVILLMVLVTKKMRLKNVSLAWIKMIDLELNRMHGVYQFFNLFTDVPMIKGSIKRRKYLDVILKRIKIIPQNTYLYLYSHGIIRDNEMSGLYRRLTIIGAVLLFFITGKILPIILCLLFIYLIGFQLIPFYFHFYDNVFVHIYPITSQNQIQSFKKVISYMLIFTAIVFGLVVTVVNIENVSTIIGTLICEAIELFIFLNIYLPRRIKKSEYNR